MKESVLGWEKGENKIQRLEELLLIQRSTWTTKESSRRCSAVGLETGTVKRKRGDDTSRREGKRGEGKGEGKSEEFQVLLLGNQTKNIRRSKMHCPRPSSKCLLHLET